MNVSDLLSSFPNGVDIGTMEGRVSSALGGDSSVFKRWYSKASVRNSPQRLFCEEDIRKEIYPKELVPYYNHPLLDKANRNHLLVYSLYRYLIFTINLEISVVNETTRRLFMSQFPINLELSELVDAQKIYVDEAYHALFSTDMLVQVSELTGIPVPELPIPFFLEWLERESVNHQDKELFLLIFTCVSEMLITDNLISVREYENVPQSIREMLNDHVADEAKHHIFYKNVLEKLLSSEIDREYIISTADSCIRAFNMPDFEQLKTCLVLSGLSDSESVKVINDTYSEELIG